MGFVFGPSLSDVIKFQDDKICLKLFLSRRIFIWGICNKKNGIFWTIASNISPDWLFCRGLYNHNTLCDYPYFTLIFVTLGNSGFWSPGTGKCTLFTLKNLSFQIKLQAVNTEYVLFTPIWTRPRIIHLKHGKIFTTFNIFTPRMIRPPWQARPRILHPRAE